MKIRFALIADIHFGPAKFETDRYKKIEEDLPLIVSQIVDKINAEDNLEFIINLGDLIQERTSLPSRDEDLKSAAKVTKILSQLRYPLYHIVGNHDRITLSVEDLRNTFGHELYYAFETAHFKVIGLFLESPRHVDVHLVPGEMEWLANQIDISEKKVLVFMHQILVEHPLEGTSCEGMPDCAYVRNKDEIKLLFESSGKVAAVFNGHMHANLYKSENGIPYFSIQAMTQPLSSSAQVAEAYAIVEIDDDGKTKVVVHGNDSITMLS